MEIIGGGKQLFFYQTIALLFDYEKGLLAFPVTVYSPPPQGNPTQYGSFEFAGAYVYDFGLDTGFSLRGKITHISEEDYLKMGNFYPYEKGVERILYANGNLYTISPFGIFAHSENDITLLNSVEFK